LNIRFLPIVLLACAAPLVAAQGTASPAKKELVAKLLQLQQPEFDQAARGLVQQPALQMMQQAGPVLQTQVPADKREAASKAIEADVRKYVDETYPLVRERALKLAPSTVGVVLEEKFSDDELKQLIAWYESPVNKKFQQLGNEMRGSFLQKLVPEARPLMQPKLQALEQQVRVSLGLPAQDAGAGAPAATPKSDAKAAAKPPARAASR
jgi:hypothetical protein